MSDRSSTEQDIGKLLIRVIVGGLMMFHGVNKLGHGVEGIGRRLVNHGLPEVMKYGVYLGEFVGPLLLVLGIATRSSAVLIAFTMVMAVYLVHPNDVMALGRHGEYKLELHIFYGVGAIAAALLGPGKYAVKVKGLEKF